MIQPSPKRAARPNAAATPPPTIRLGPQPAAAARSSPQVALAIEDASDLVQGSVLPRSPVRHRGAAGLVVVLAASEPDPKHGPTAAGDRVERRICLATSAALMRSGPSMTVVAAGSVR